MISVLKAFSLLKIFKYLLHEFDVLGRRAVDTDSVQLCHGYLYYKVAFIYMCVYICICIHLCVYINNNIHVVYMYACVFYVLVFNCRSPPAKQ